MIAIQLASHNFLLWDFFTNLKSTTSTVWHKEIIHTKRFSIPIRSITNFLVFALWLYNLFIDIINFLLVALLLLSYIFMSKSTKVRFQEKSRYWASIEGLKNLNWSSVRPNKINFIRIFYFTSPDNFVHNVPKEKKKKVREKQKKIGKETKNTGKGKWERFTSEGLLIWEHWPTLIQTWPKFCFSTVTVPPRD